MSVLSLLFRNRLSNATIEAKVLPLEVGHTAITEEPAKISKTRTRCLLSSSCTLPFSFSISSCFFARVKSFSHKKDSLIASAMAEVYLSIFVFLPFEVSDIVMGLLIALSTSRAKLSNFSFQLFSSLTKVLFLDVLDVDVCLTRSGVAIEVLLSPTSDTSEVFIFISSMLISSSHFCS